MFSFLHTESTEVTDFVLNMNDHDCEADEHLLNIGNERTNYPKIHFFEIYVKFMQIRVDFPVRLRTSVFISDHPCEFYILNVVVSKPKISCQCFRFRYRFRSLTLQRYS